MDFFTADGHLNDPHILRHANRPYTNYRRMTKDLINRHNSVVGVQDKVYMIGDVAMGTGEMIRWLIGQLNGHKILILGNHDMRKPNEFWLNAGFTEVHAHLDMPIAGHMARLKHIPYPAKQIPAEIDIVVCGHIHDFRPPPPQHVCVCVEVTNYTPLSLEQVAMQVKYDDIHNDKLSQPPKSWREPHTHDTIKDTITKE